MVGIIAYGAYVPYNRLERKRISEAHGGNAGKGEKSVASHDEDSLSMAVEATMDALTRVDKNEIDALFYATTTSPYKEKSASAIMAHALDLKREIRTVNLTDTLKASSSALLAAVDAVKSGLNLAVVAISDSRVGQVQGSFENVLGDGAASFIIGKDNPLATIEATYSVTRDITDQWRSSNDDYLRSWEERFGLTTGYEPLIKDAVNGIIEQERLTKSDITKVIIAGPQEKNQKSIGRAIGFSAEQLHLGHEETIGNTGTAQAPLLLADVLEQSNPGDTILMVTYGSGSDAILLKVTDSIRSFSPRKGFSNLLNSKKTDLTYMKYLKWKNMLPVEPPRRPEIPRPSAPAMARNQIQTLSGYGSKCTSCGTPQYPIQEVCMNCGCIGEKELYRFVDKKAQIVTYTSDYLTVSADPPSTFVVVDFEGGGRMITELVDYKIDQLDVGMELEMTFRHLYEAGSIHNYAWKVRPKR